MTLCPSSRLRSYIRPVRGGRRLLANMDSRAPRANRGVGLERQGCYRPDAVSVGPKGHGSGHSLSISGEGHRVRLGGVGQGEWHIFCQTAQTMRPSLFATAIVALLWPAPGAQGDRPVMQPSERLAAGRATMRHEEDGAGPVRQQAAKVDVAVLTDAPSRR